MSTTETISFLDQESVKAARLADGIVAIGRDATEERRRAELLREARDQLAGLQAVVERQTLAL